MGVEQSPTVQLPIDRGFEKGFTKEYVQDVGPTLDGDPGALTCGRNRDAPDRRDMGMWRPGSNLVANKPAVLQIERNPYEIRCADVELSPAVTPSGNHCAG